MLPVSKNVRSPLCLKLLITRRGVNVTCHVTLGNLEASLDGERYDLRADPAEATNLWADPRHAARRAHLPATLVASEVQLVAGRGGTCWPPGKS